MSRAPGTFFGDPGLRGNGPPNIDGMITLKIDNIPFNCTVEELRYAFERWGELGDVYIPRDLHTGNPRGFAFVRYMDQRDADQAIDRMDGERLGGRELRIQYAKRRRPDYDSYFGGGGGYGGTNGGFGRDDYRRGRSRSRSPRRRSRSSSRSYDRRRGRRSRSRSSDRRRSRNRSDSSRPRSNSRSRSPRRSEHPSNDSRSNDRVDDKDKRSRIHEDDGVDGKHNTTPVKDSGYKYFGNGREREATNGYSHSSSDGDSDGDGSENGRGRKRRYNGGSPQASSVGESGNVGYGSRGRQ